MRGLLIVIPLSTPPPPPTRELDLPRVTQGPFQRALSFLTTSYLCPGIDGQGGGFLVYPVPPDTRDPLIVDRIGARP